MHLSGAWSATGNSGRLTKTPYERDHPPDLLARRQTDPFREPGRDGSAVGCGVWRGTALLQGRVYHSGKRLQVVFSPDGTLACSCCGQAVCAWDLKARKFKWWSWANGIEKAAFTRDGRSVLMAAFTQKGYARNAGHFTVIRRDAITGERQNTYEARIEGPADKFPAIVQAVFLPDGYRVLTGDTQGGIHVWKLPK